jgi:hypothetical protein
MELIGNAIYLCPLCAVSTLTHIWSEKIWFIESSKTWASRDRGEIQLNCCRRAAAITFLAAANRILHRIHHCLRGRYQDKFFHIECKSSGVVSLYHGNVRGVKKSGKS